MLTVDHKKVTRLLRMAGTLLRKFPGICFTLTIQPEFAMAKIRSITSARPSTGGRVGNNTSGWSTLRGWKDI